MLVEENDMVGTKEAAEITGHTVHMLHYLQRHSILKASNSTGRRGVERRYSSCDLLILKLIKQLVEHGVSILNIGGAFSKIKEEYPNISDPKFRYQFMVTDGTTINLKRSVDTLRTIADKQQSACVFVLNIEIARAEVEQSYQFPVS